MSMNPPGASTPADTSVMIRSFRSAVRANFSFLKSINSLVDLYAGSLPLGKNQGVLLPVCELHATDDALISRLAAWREATAFAFPTRFPVTTAGTANWLRKHLLEVDDRVLFLVLDRHGRAIGHLGFANSLNDALEMEIDNVVRGLPDSEPGIMGRALETLIDWAEEVIGAQRIFLRVLSDNSHAIDFYHRHGFTDGVLIPLRRHVRDETTSFEPVASEDPAPADAHFLTMEYNPQTVCDGTELILTAGPSISSREACYALDAARHGWNHQWNEYLRRFEQGFAQTLGVEHAIATSSCTGALHIALAALGIGHGDEVIVPDLTWVATANAVLYVGATPVFADVEETSWCLDPTSFEALITDRTRAVIPVHLYGHPAPMERIVEIARKHDLYIIEDAAASLGAETRGRGVGTFGDFAAFSFQGAKVLVTGEGGVLVTGDPELHAKALAIWDQGRVAGTFWIAGNGLKYKMSNIQAALGLAQLERLDELVAAKRRIFSWYEQNLGDLGMVSLNKEAPGVHSSYWMTSLLLDSTAGMPRDEVCKRLKELNVDTRPVFPAISQYQFWPRAQETQPVAKMIGEWGLNLPSGVCLKRHQVDYVSGCVRELLQ